MVFIDRDFSVSMIIRGIKKYQMRILWLKQSIKFTGNWPLSYNYTSWNSIHCCVCLFAFILFLFFPMQIPDELKIKKELFLWSTRRTEKFSVRNKSLKVFRTSFFDGGVVWCVCDSESKTINLESAIQAKGMVDNLNNRQISGTTFTLNKKRICSLTCSAFYRVFNLI